MKENGNTNSGDQLTRGSLLARNTVLNLFGFSIPTVVALLAIPRIINGLGIERFGVLTLAWMVIGYFSFFDLGLGRVLTILVARRLGTDQEDRIPALVSTCLLLMLIMGICGTLLTLSLSPWLVHHLLKIPADLQAESLHAFILLGMCVPIVISTAGLRGVLAAHQRFGLINIVDTSNGLFTFLSPVATLSFSSDLGVIVSVLVVGRVFLWLVYVFLVHSTMPRLHSNIRLRFDEVPSMLRWGGWMTVSGVVGPIMVYFDRFLIGALVSVAAVAFYVTPYGVAGRLGIIPQALVKVLFPAFSRSLTDDPRRAVMLFVEGAKYVFLALFPIVMLGVTFASLALEIWLGKEFSENATRVLQWFLIGILINGPAQIAFALIQAAGRSDLTAKLHLTELPFYLLALWWMTLKFGIEGAAIVSVARVTVDAIVLFWIARRLLGESGPITRVLFLSAATVASLTLGMLPLAIPLKGVVLLFVFTLFGVGTWGLLLSRRERNTVKHWLRVGRQHQCQGIDED